MNEDNHIRQQFQSKFSDFKSPVPPDGWSRLEKSLNAAAAAKAMRRRRYIGAAAAVFVLLLGSLLFLPQTADFNETVVTETIPPQETVTHKENRLQTAEHTPAKAVEKQSAPVVRVENRKEQKSDYKKTSSTSNMLAAWFSKKKQTVREQIRSQETDNLPRTEITAETEKANEQERNQLMEEFSRTTETETLFAGGATPERQSKLMVSFGGKGGLTSFQKTVNSPMTLRSASIDKSDGHFSEYAQNNHPQDIKNALTTVNSANNISEMIHAQPVSFGFTVSKPLLHNLSVETGLVYTYLFSEAKNTSTNSHSQETQHFHYVGIPLNVNYTILSLNKLQVYTSMGGMVEKDVYGKRKYQAQTSNELSGETGEEWKTERIRQEKPQFSVNAGVGVSYPIHENFNIYGKLGGSYHFETNNNYKTIYSDKKIMLDLNVGVRYEF